MKKEINISECQWPKGVQAHDCYIFYGDAKRAGIRTGDVFNMIDSHSGKTLDGDYIAEDYITWRDDIQRVFKGFACIKDSNN